MKENEWMDEWMFQWGILLLTKYNHVNATALNFNLERHIKKIHWSQILILCNQFVQKKNLYNVLKCTLYRLFIVSRRSNFIFIAAYIVSVSNVDVPFV